MKMRQSRGKMSNIETLKKQREASLKATLNGPPAKTSNPFFGVGPITDMTADEVERRQLGFEFQKWLEAHYRKIDARGEDIGPITKGEMDRGMHRGYPADQVVLDMMRKIHHYFCFPPQNRMAVGLGGGHNGFTVSVLHLMNPNRPQQKIFVDTPKPESKAAEAGGFFRQSWATQLIELHRFSKNGQEARIHFSHQEGHIPPAETLARAGIELFIGVGHETTGATSYSTQEVQNLLTWIEQDPENHHALVDGTSMLGAMPWPSVVRQQVMERCCIFTPFQKAIGGIAGYFILSLTPPALKLVEQNIKNPAWAIPRHLKIAVPENPKQPFSGKHTATLGPIYDAMQDKMLGGIINTFNNSAFAETLFRLVQVEKRIGSVEELNKRATQNRQEVTNWVAQHPLFELGVQNEESRGAAVTLLKVVDPDISDPAVHSRIIAKSKQLLGYEGVCHPNGTYEAGLDVARYINAFPGTPGDFRAWIGGIRPTSDIIALLDNLEYCYHRAKIVVLEEELAEQGISFEGAEAPSDGENKAGEPEKIVEALRVLAENLAATWGALATINTAERNVELRQHYGRQLLEDSKNYASKLEEWQQNHS